MNISGSFAARLMASSTECAVSVDGAFQLGSDVITMLRRFGSAPLGSDSNVRRPMITVCPLVSSLKCFKSSDIWYMRLPLRPMAPREAVMAAIIVSIVFLCYVCSD